MTAGAWAGMVTPEELAWQVAAAPRTPLVSAFGLTPDYDHTAALLAWGRHHPSGLWWGGVSFPHRGRRGTALLTVWVPARQVQRRRGELYLDVPRVALAGPAEGWPALPPVYPGAVRGAVHRHLAEPDPTGRYRYPGG